jgi:hypothetical protein
MALLRIATVLLPLLVAALPTQAIQDRERPALSGYGIQIIYQSGQSSHFLIPAPKLKVAGSFTIPPGEIIKRADTANEQVSMVKVSAAFEKDIWRINISAVKGEFYDKGEQDVATFLVRENEKMTVKEMGQFGIKSFDISIVKVDQSAAILPKIRNRTQSIEVTNVEAITVPSPYRILLRNLSYKSVLALEVSTYNRDYVNLLKWPQGTWDRPLIEPGGTYEEELPSAGQGRVTDNGYVPEQSAAIEISTVVFEDGTYEGKPYLAAVTKANMMGSKAQLVRVIALLQAAREPAGELNVRTMTGLKEAISVLSEDADPGQLKDLQAQFPSLDEGAKKNLANFMRSGLHSVKVTLLKEIEAFEKEGQPTSGSSVTEWVGKTKDKCEKWVSAL